jgi:hypothetical protein
LKALPPEKLLALLNEWGCPTVVERGDRAFPASGKASDVTRALTRRLETLGVRVLQGRRAAKYLRELCTERASQSVKATNRPVPVKTQEPRIDTDEINLDDLSEFCDDALLTLISTAQEISQARKAACPRGHRPPPFRVAEAMAGASV